MKTNVVLLRGINVGGRNALPMKELVVLLEELGCESVQTYIQSGNVVLRSNAKTASQLPGKIIREINSRRGFEPHVLVLEAEQVKRIAAKNPFPEAESDPKSVHVGFLDSVPKAPDLERLEAMKTDSERFQLIDKAFYLHAPDGVGRSKLAAGTEQALGVPMTDRNCRTISKLLSMIEELE